MLSQLGLNDDDDETSLTSLIYLQQPIEVPTEDGRCMNSELLDLEVNASVFVSKLDSIFQFYDFVPNSKEVYVQLSLSRVQSKIHSKALSLVVLLVVVAQESSLLMCYLDLHQRS